MVNEVMSYMKNDCVDFFVFFFFNDTATTEIYTLSLHDALPIFHILFVKSGYISETSVLKLDKNRIQVGLKCTGIVGCVISKNIMQFIETYHL